MCVGLALTWLQAGDSEIPRRPARRRYLEEINMRRCIWVFCGVVRSLLQLRKEGRDSNVHFKDYIALYHGKERKHWLHELDQIHWHHRATCIRVLLCRNCIEVPMMMKIGVYKKFEPSWMPANPLCFLLTAVFFCLCVRSFEQCTAVLRIPLSLYFCHAVFLNFCGSVWFCFQVLGNHQSSL